VGYLCNFLIAAKSKPSPISPNLVTLMKNFDSFRISPNLVTLLKNFAPFRISRDPVRVLWSAKRCGNLPLKFFCQKVKFFSFEI
jgi:hypothetical protein